MVDDYYHVALVALGYNDVEDLAYTCDDEVSDNDTYNGIHSNSSTACNKPY